jgi:hypothetical protein
MLGQRAKQRRVTSLTLMQRRPLAALALIEWTRASLGLDQIGRSEVMLIAIPMPDHATRVLAGVYDPRGLRRNEPLDPAFAINPHQLTRIWASKGRVRSCAAANENALRGDRKRLPNELWLNRHGGGLLTPMRQKIPVDQFCLRPGFVSRGFVSRGFVSPSSISASKRSTATASSWRSLGVGLVPRHQRQSALRVSASGGARLETTQKLYNGEAEYRSGGRIRPS